MVQAALGSYVRTRLRLHVRPNPPGPTYREAVQLQKRDALGPAGVKGAALAGTARTAVHLCHAHPGVAAKVAQHDGGVAAAPAAAVCTLTVVTAALGRLLLLGSGVHHKLSPAACTRRAFRG